MGQSVIKLDQATMEKLKKFYEPHATNEPPEHTILLAKKNGCTITAYKSGKVMFQGPSHEEEAGLWVENIEKPEKKSPNFTNQAHIGSDEAGTGDYFGPITVAAVFATEKQLALLRELGVKDSKSMKDHTITSIVKDFLQMDLIYSSLTLNNEKYNSLQKRGWSQGRMKAWMHHHAIKNVYNKLQNKNDPKGVLIDQFCQPDIFYKHVQATGETPHTDLTFLTKAESHSTVVAAASMIARYRFIQEMGRLSQLVGFELQKGASKIVDRQIKQIINKHGQDYLNQIAKVHFANTQKALSHPNR